MWKGFENLVELDKNVEKKIAIAVNATRDVSGSVPIELVTESWEIVLIDPFELFFKDPIKSRSRYESVFNEISELLNENEESTKLSVFSHSTNSGEIRNWITDEFKISFVISEWVETHTITIGKLIWQDEIIKRLWKNKIQNIENYWL